MLLIAVIALALQTPQAAVGTKIVTVKSGLTSIRLPVPEGFHEVSGLPEMWRLAEHLVPPKNRLLAAFVSEDDVGRFLKDSAPELKRYMLVQVSRDYEGTAISDSEFADLARTIKQQQGSLIERFKAGVDSDIVTRSREMSADYGIPVDIKLGQHISLGVFLERSDAISFATMGKVRGVSGDESIDYVIAASASFLKLSEKLVYVYVYGVYESPQDLQWVRTKSTAWVDQILTANAGATALDPLDKGASSLVDRVTTKGIRGALVGAVLGGLVGLFQLIRRKRLSA